MSKKSNETGLVYDPKMCTTVLKGIRDAKDVLNGKWKTYIIGVLIFQGNMRFMDLLREVEGIAPRMLSKELQELEMQKLVSRTILDTKPISVEYAITEHGKTLGTVLDEMAKWGMLHRDFTIGQHSQ